MNNFFDLTQRAADNRNTSYENPQPGITQAICIDIIDGKWSKNTFQGLDRGWRHTVFILFEINQRFTDGPYKGKRFVVANEYTFSIHPKATLRRDIESWIGQKLIEQRNADGSTSLTVKTTKGNPIVFNLEMLKGKSCFLCLENVSKEGVFIKATKIMPFDKTKNQPMSQETKAGYIPKWLENKLAEREDEDPGVVLERKFVESKTIEEPVPTEDSTFDNAYEDDLVSEDIPF